MKDYCPRVASAMLLVYFNEPDCFLARPFTRTGEGLEAFKMCDFRDQQVVRFLWTQKKNAHREHAHLIFSFVKHEYFPLLIM